MLDLACSNSLDGAFRAGTHNFLVGDSRSGKTFLSLTCLAEASINPAFDDYEFIHDDVEGGALMDIEKFFGSRVAKRLRAPKYDDDNSPVYSRTVEEFYDNFFDAMDRGPCIYIEDSMDSLSSAYEEKRVTARKKHRQGKGEEVKGDYSDGKAKLNAQYLRLAIPKLAETNSILIIINQTRDNVGGGIFDPKKTRSGGHALTFYSTIEIWSSVGSDIKKNVKGKDRIIGVNCRINIKKNRLQGQKRRVDLPIYYSHGIDDLGSCVDFLVDEKQWDKKRGTATITVPEEDLGISLSGTKNKIIGVIEEEGLEEKVKELVARVWADLEKACAIPRKPRYE